LVSIADIEVSRGDVDAALVKYQEALEIRRSLAKALGNPQSLHDLRYSQNDFVRATRLIAERDLAGGHTESALARLDAVRDLAEEMGQVEDPIILDTAAAFFELRARVLEALQQPALAAADRERAKSIRDRIAKGDHG
jgi:hypothetical protein